MRAREAPNPKIPRDGELLEGEAREFTSRAEKGRACPLGLVAKMAMPPFSK